MKIWIEMSRDNEHGGGEWRFTQCIWAPTYKKGAKENVSWPFWDNVKKVSANDIILHLRGKGKTACFVGYSVAETNGHKTTERPLNPGKWDYCQSFYRAYLKNFICFSSPINLYRLFDEKRELFEDYLCKKADPKNLFYTIQSGRLQCLNGGYLTEAEDDLLSILFGQTVISGSDTRNVAEFVSTSEVLRQIKTRMGHEQFSKNVKKNFNHHCCFPECDIDDDNFLIASHIARWVDNPEKRGETANGLCLCLIHDKAFEKGYFSLNDSLKIHILKTDIKSEVFQKFILPYEGVEITKGIIEPDKEALQEHRNRCTL